MATLMANKPKVATTWQTVFPATVSTQKQSLAFVKKLVAVGVSTVVYLRADLPEDAFVKKNLDGIHIPLMRSTSPCQPANEICKWVKSAMEAMEAGYLRELQLIIYLDENDPNSVHELYTFHFEPVHGATGQNGGPSGDCQYSSESFKKATRQLLRNLVITTQGLDSLPDNAYLTMKIRYYDEITPQDYEPPGFEPCTPSEYEVRFADSQPEPVRCGEVETRWHRVNVGIRSKAYGVHTPSSQCSAVYNSQPPKEKEPTPAVSLSAGLDMDYADNDDDLNCDSQTVRQPKRPLEEDADTQNIENPERKRASKRACNKMVKLY